MAGVAAARRRPARARPRAALPAGRTACPDLDELASPALRRWLRAVTALQWYAPASAVELTDPDGRYAYVPLDAGRLALDGERTRGP